MAIACSRLRDGGGKSFSNKKCEKRAGAGERQGAPFPKSCASYFRFARFNTFPLYYLRAWHRLTWRTRQSRAFLFCHHREQQLHKIMSEGYPNGLHLNKKTIVHTEKKFMDVSEEALFAVLHGRYIFRLDISAKPAFILRKSKGNSYSQTCMIFRIR